MSNEALSAARALLPGAEWASYTLSVLPFFGGFFAAFCGERRFWLVGALWGVAMLGLWGPFNALGAVQWMIGAVALSGAGWALLVGRKSRRAWLLGPVICGIVGFIVRQFPVVALTLGTGGADAATAYALERAEAGEVDEGIVFGDAALEIAPEDPQAALVVASLYAAEGDCDTAVVRARIAHLGLGSDLPRMDAAIRACLSARGP
jgi:hypothetical protein